MASASLVGFASTNRMSSGLQAFGVGVQPVARGIFRTSIRYDVGDWFYSSRSYRRLDWSNGVRSVSAESGQWVSPSPRNKDFIA